MQKNPWKDINQLNNINHDNEDILNTVDWLSEQYGESFYLFDLDRLRENYLRMCSAFSNRYNHIIIGYSYKTNYLPSLIKEMNYLGAHAEVVSRLEYDLALKIGVDPKKIIFNGPLKSYDDLVTALENGSIINLDSSYEIEMLEKIVAKNNNRAYKVGLRVNFELIIDGLSPLQSGFKQSRFGFCIENGDFERAITKLSSIENVEVVGLHGHFSTKKRSLNIYQKIIQKLCDVSKKYIADTLEYIDIGGGFYGDVPKTMNLKNVPTFDDYAEVICSILNKEKIHFKKEPFLIVEPGLSLVVDTFKFYCQVIDVKKNGDQYFVLVNGSVHNIKPNLTRQNTPMEHIEQRNLNYEKDKFNVVGYTCMEKDYLLIDYIGNIPKVRDFLIFSNVGAYTIVLNPPFIKERPPIVEKEGNQYKIVRKRERLNDFVNSNVYVF